MAQYHWDPERYLELIREEVPGYDRLQGHVARAAAADAESVLELGTGTGESARRVLEANPRAHLIGIDASGEMLARARRVLPAGRVHLLVKRLEDPLPDGAFDLVVSVLALHHLDSVGKADLFRRIAAVLAPSGRFVLGDVVVPADPADMVTPVDGVYDKPSSVAEQVEWLQDAGLRARIAWARRDLAVVAAEPRDKHYAAASSANDQPAYKTPRAESGGETTTLASSLFGDRVTLMVRNATPGDAHSLPRLLDQVGYDPSAGSPRSACASTRLRQGIGLRWSTRSGRLLQSAAAHGSS